jgi:hydroxymethylbilane synthase
VTPVRIGTRGSTLARAQAAWVSHRLEENNPGIKVEVILIKTSGDRFLDVPIPAVGGKGIFVKEIEEALLKNEIDLAVHSMKDLPTEMPPGLTIAAVPEREDPRDVLVSRNGKSLKELPAAARVATGSPRRKSQILYYRGDLSLVAIRGNVDTRLKKLDAGEFDGLIMAAAGLKRIGRQDRITEFIAPEICLSAVAQGALGLECREGDGMDKVLSFLHHPPTYAEIIAERSFLRQLGGGCQVPVGARAWVNGEELKLWGVVADTEGSKIYRGNIAGLKSRADRLGVELAETLLRQGADVILASGGPHGSNKDLIHGR